MAKCIVRMCRPATTTPSTTTPPPPIQTQTQPTDTSMSGLPSEATASSTTSLSGSTGTDFAVPTTQPMDDNTALIGGIVGGIVALLLIVAVIAFIVARKRKQGESHGQSMTPTPATESNYSRIDVQPKYDDVSDVRTTEHHQSVGTN
jgi:hypothetical protein